MHSFLKKALFLFSILLVLFTESCSEHISVSSDEQNPSSTSTNEPPVDYSSIQEKTKGLIYIPVSTNTITIGSKINTVLNYHFLIGEHEVTCGEYGYTACANDSLPIADVTLFDAILFANAKSKAENFDTIYTYSKATFDSQNHCTKLDDIVFRYDKIGYRLPTEAEWIAAASLAWNVNNSWNSGNSENTTHKVCSIGKDNAGFCDFAGNVMEWVNDWFVEPKDTTLENFIGGAKAVGLGERVIKGGSYTNDASSINLYSRGDVYTVTSATHTNYVGFRLAIGKIPNPTTIGDVTPTSQIPTIFLANADAIKALTGTYATKLAFRNDVTGNLAYVDYSDITLPLIEIADTLNAYHPDISPNGEWVAFSTTEEGISGNSSIYVRKLDPQGSNLVKLNVESAAIPRWVVSSNGDTAIVYVTDAGNNAEDTEWKLKSTWKVPFANGIFGIPQKLFDGSFHGGISEDASLAITGARKLRARTSEPGAIYGENARDTIWYNGEQACNASLAKDGTNRTAFLDFGGKTGREFVGENYATHQRILIADNTGKLIQSIKALQGYTFDHIEWAGNEQATNIVGTLSNTDGAHTHIVLVNVKDSTILPIVQGEELWHPCLWVSHSHIKKQPSDTITKTDFQLNLDSAGAYIKTTTGQIHLYAVKWRYKLELLWKYKDSINTAIVGSSRALHGVIPSLLNDKFKAINFANSNNTLYCTKFFLDNYALPHIENLKYIVMSVDIDRGFNTEKQSFLLSNRKDYIGYIYDENHNFWKDSGAPKELAQYTHEALGYSPYAFLRETLGYEQIEADSGWKNPAIMDSMWMARNPELYYANFELLKGILEETNKRGIFVIGVIFPQSPAYQQTGAFGFGGIQRSKAPALIQELASLSTTFPNFILMDENKMGKHDYTDDMANDFNHLAHLGAIKFTSRLDSLLQTLSK